MRRRQVLKTIAAIGASVTLMQQKAAAHTIDLKLQIDELKKPMKNWKALLSDKQYEILFEEGTEPAGSSPLNNIKQSGTYICSACYLPLFESESKYDSGTGWPSFYQTIEGRIDTKVDLKLIWPRTEYHCIRCGGHQGHVFTDGPKPTGLRYCNNGLALEFIPDTQLLPELRT